MTLAKIELDLHPQRTWLPGGIDVTHVGERFTPQRVVVDGVDLTHSVQHVRVYADPTGSSVELDMSAEVRIQGEAEMRYAVQMLRQRSVSTAWYERGIGRGETISAALRDLADQLEAP